MLTNTLKELAAAKAKVAELEQMVQTEMHNELRTLPQTYGFDSADAFIAAVRAATGKRRGRTTAVAAGAVARKGKRTRAKITDETRAEVKKLVQAGKTGNEIARSLGISLPSVQNIKKALGLVRKR